jgi:hypothetical protein
MAKTKKAAPKKQAEPEKKKRAKTVYVPADKVAHILPEYMEVFTRDFRDGTMSENLREVVSLARFEGAKDERDRVAKNEAAQRRDSASVAVAPPPDPYELTQKVCDAIHRFSTAEQNNLLARIIQELKDRRHIELETETGRLNFYREKHIQKEEAMRQLQEILRGYHHG